MLRSKAVLATVLFSGLTAADATAAPTVKVSAASGPPTSVVTVSVSGYAARAAVDVYFDTTDLCLIVTSSTGAGSCVIRVPQNARPQSHWISALQRNNNTGAQAAYLVRTDWPFSHGQTSQNDGFNRYENTIGPSNVGQLALAWEAAPAKQFGTTPVVAGGKLFVGSIDGILYGFDAKTGKTLAGFPKTVGGQFLYDSPFVYKGVVYATNILPGGTSKIYAYNVSTTKLLPKFPLSLTSIAVGSPTIGAGKLFVADQVGKVYAFNPTTGAKIAPFPITVAGAPAIYSSIAYDQGRLFFGANDNTMYIYSATTGAQLKSLLLTQQFSAASPSISDRTVYFGAAHERKIRSDDYDLASNWAAPFTLAGDMDGTPAVAYAKVYVADTAGTVYAIDAATGTAKWTTSVSPGGTHGACVVANGVVYASVGGRLTALDAKTGEILASLGASTVTDNQLPVVVDGMVYVAATTGGVRAYAPAGVTPTGRPAAATEAARPSFAGLKPDLTLKPQSEAEIRALEAEAAPRD